MIFILHYILFNAGLSAILILITLFLQTYSDASLTEIGALLMVLPFVSIVAKPLFCALADRQQAHKYYLAGSLGFMVLGYGSLAIAPFYPDFVHKHGRLVWYLDVIGIIVGFSAFGVVWSLGDALAVNAARIKGVPWGSYRVWATISWGVFGWLIGQINETPLLPKYVPAFLVLAGSLLLEIVLVLLWPKRHFDMTADEKQPAAAMSNGDQKQQQQRDVSFSGGGGGGGNTREDDFELNDAWLGNRSLSGTLSGSARVNPRLMGAVANIVMEDIGSSIKSSLRLGQPQKRSGLMDILEQHQLTSAGLSQAGLQQQQQQQIYSTAAAAAAAATAAAPNGAAAASPAANGGASPQALLGRHHHQHSPAITSSVLSKSPLSQATTGAGGGVLGGSVASRAATLGRSALHRTQLALSRMNSLSSATGHAIADELRDGPLVGPPDATGSAYFGTPQKGSARQQMMVMSSLASNASLSRAAAARALGFGAGNSSSSCAKESPIQHANGNCNNLGELSTIEDSMISGEQQSGLTSSSSSSGNGNGSNCNRSVEDLQMVLLKLIVKRDAGIFKYLIMFILFGMLFAIHTDYFFLHVELLCRQKGFDFSSVMGALVAMQSVSEVFSFMVIAPYYMPRVGRLGSLLTIGLMFAIRSAFYGTYYAQLSPYSALATEACHGVAYGMTYTLITDIATECVNQVDLYLPELIQRRIVDPQIHPNQLKLPLRATMQGVFSGAFDGLGNGIGALFAGIYLDAYSYSSLWLLCCYMSVIVSALYPLTEWRRICGGAKSKVACQVTD